MKQHSNLKLKQRGSALFIMIMILVALSILTFMATNIGKSDARIGNAYAEQTRAFIQAEEMLARLRYAIEQMPLPEGIKNESSADSKDTIIRPIWLTNNLSNTLPSKDGEPDFTNPNFAGDSGSNDGWSDDHTLTCNELATWMKNYSGINVLHCGSPSDLNGLDPYGRTQTVIDLVSRRQNKGDIGDIRDAFYYRITIRAKGDSTGKALAQGITGVQYN